jgi:hypothetical protein
MHHYGNTWGTWQLKFETIDRQTGMVPAPLVIAGQMRQKGFWL